MLFTQQDLGVSTNAFGILNESIYIDHNTISPNTASVIVNEDINAGIVRFSDVESISEEYGCDYIDAMIAIAESNDIDIEQLAVAVDEARIIEEPDIIYELANVVINPISENSLAYIFCESMVDAYIDSGDEDYLSCIIDEGVGDFIMRQSDRWSRFKNSKPISILRKGPISGYIAHKEFKRQQEQQQNVADTKELKSQLGAANEKITAQAKELEAIKKQIAHKPKSWISRKIASLRKIYANYMSKAKQEGPNASVFKKIAAKVLSVIDALLKRLEEFTA